MKYSKPREFPRAKLTVFPATFENIWQAFPTLPAALY